MRIRRTAVIRRAALAAGLFLTTAARADSLYTFDTGASPVGTSTPFSLTDNGITATFSSPGEFQVTPGVPFAPPMSGNVLLDTGAEGNANIPLDISFSTAVNSVTLDFATDNTFTMELTAYLDGEEVGEVSMDGSVPDGFFFPQGVLSFNGATFDSLELVDTIAPAFAIDNVDVTAAAAAGAVSVPEFNAWGMGACAALAIGFFRWRLRMTGHDSQPGLSSAT